MVDVYTTGWMGVIYRMSSTLAVSCVAMTSRGAVLLALVCGLVALSLHTSAAASLRQLQHEDDTESVDALLNRLKDLIGEERKRRIYSYKTMGTLRSSVAARSSFFNIWCVTWGCHYIPVNDSDANKETDKIAPESQTKEKPFWFPHLGYG